MGGIVGGVLSLGGALISSSASKKAGKTQAAAADAATQLEREQFEYQKEVQAPFLEEGTNALKRYADIVLRGNQDLFKTSPGYDFRFKEGQRAVAQSAAAKGGLFSGNTLKALTEYGQNVGTSEFQNYLNQIGSLSGIGQTASQDLTRASQQFGSSAAGNILYGGAARASGQVGAANAYTSGINNVLSSMSYGQPSFNMGNASGFQYVAGGFGGIPYGGWGGPPNPYLQ